MDYCCFYKNRIFKIDKNFIIRFFLIQSSFKYKIIKSNKSPSIILKNDRVCCVVNIRFVAIIQVTIKKQNTLARTVRVLH